MKDNVENIDEINEINEVNLNLHIYARAALNSNADVTLEELRAKDPEDPEDPEDLEETEKENNCGRPSRNF